MDIKYTFILCLKNLSHAMKVWVSEWVNVREIRQNQESEIPIQLIKMGTEISMHVQNRF